MIVLFPIAALAEEDAATEAAPVAPEVTKEDALGAALMRRRSGK